MTVVRVQHSFQGKSLQPEDRYVNVFHFITPGVPSFTITERFAISNFYATTPLGASASIGSFMSGVADSPGAMVKVFNLSDPIPRQPIYEEQYTPADMGTGSSRNLPSEVAMCLSYRAAALAGSPPARRRGRIYLGPFCDKAIAPGPTNASESQPHEDLRNAAVKSAAEMAATMQAGGFDWAVYSPTDGDAISIAECWVDDAWDTQRRRGNKPTARQSETIA